MTQTEWQILPWVRLVGELMHVTLYTSMYVLQIVITHMHTGRKQPGGMHLSPPSPGHNRKDIFLETVKLVQDQETRRNHKGLLKSEKEVRIS